MQFATNIYTFLQLRIRHIVNSLLSINPFEWPGILSALLCGSIIGMERQILGKPVGIRTSSLICLGTYAFIVVANSVASDNTDPSRVIGQVITGIGFLGAGVILARDGMVLGVTSASAIWMLAAIGVIIGSGFYAVGIKIAVLTVLVLVGVDWFESSFRFLQRGVHKRLFARNGNDTQQNGDQ